MAELIVDAVMQNMESVVAFSDEILESSECPVPVKVQRTIAIALDEIFSNICYYAFDDTPGRVVIDISVSSSPASVSLTLKDNGKPYNPLKAPEPDITASADERAIGGLGIFMVKKSMDTISYGYENGQNVLSMTKLIG